MQKFWFCHFFHLDFVLTYHLFGNLTLIWKAQHVLDTQIFEEGAAMWNGILQVCFVQG